MFKKGLQPMLSVDFKTEFDSESDEIRTNSRACLSLEALQGGFIKEVGANRLGVLLAILSFMDVEGKSFPSQRKLAELTGQSTNTVNKLIGELLEIQINGKHILKRELVGNGFKKRSMYYIHAGEVTGTDTVSEESAEPVEMNSKDVATLFMEVYEETYSAGYVVNWGRDLSMIKKKLLPAFSSEELVGIVTIAVEQYTAKWGNKDYPTPTIPMLCSWLANNAYGVYKQDKAKADNSSKRLAEATEQDDTDKAMDLL